MVLAFGAGGVAGALGHAHSILGLGFSAVAGFSSCNSVLILAGDGSIASVRVDGSFGAIRALGDTYSILALSFSAVTGLCGCYAVRILLGDSSVARIRINGRGSVAILANGLTAKVRNAILRQ